MLITLPKGTLESEIRDNTNLGGTVWLYILLNAIRPIYKDISKSLIDPEKNEDMIDAILQLVKDDLMEAAEEGYKEAEQEGEQNE